MKKRVFNFLKPIHSANNVLFNYKILNQLKTYKNRTNIIISTTKYILPNNYRIK